jgi:AmiR/NasT family two-component response regulator
MDIFRRRPGSLAAGELNTALLLADLVVEVLLDWQEDSGLRGNGDASLVMELGDRAQLFQAQGMIMVQLGIPPAEALIRMRAYAFAHNRRLDDVAREIANGMLTLDAEPT